MAEPRKVPFVTISSFNNNAPPSESKKRRREDEAEISLGEDGGGGSAATGPGGGTGASPFGNVKAGDGDSAETKRVTVRLNLSLPEPSERGSAEFNYSELVQSTQVKKPPAPGPPKGLTPDLDPNYTFADNEKERREVEALANKFESKYSQGNTGKKKRKDRVQDLIDIGFGYDETDPFIDNSEAYDELVPASLNTKLGGFYINTGTLQFRAASESEGEDFKKLKDGEERVIKKRRKKQDGSNMDEKKPRKIRMPKQGVSGLNVHRPEKKKRKKLMKDSLNLAAMLRRFTREKEENRKKNPCLSRGQHNANSALLNAHPKPNDISMADLANDPAMMSLLGSANNNDMLQDMMGDLDFGLLDSPQPSSPAQGENGVPGRVQGRVQGAQGGLLPPPPLPNGLPAPLSKRIEDLRVASHQFDQEGRKKFFTLDMNNILLDIELQVQEQPAAVRSSVYSHLEAFVPCNKEALLKRLKKLSLNIQDDRLRSPLLKLKLAVCSVMPEQIARYNMDCIAKVAKQQSEEGEKNGSEEEDEEKPGKRVMGPRKKFVWDEKLRMLLCNLVRVKLGCYELEGQSSLSPEDYLKIFMETEVKPLWPKGWMQARMLFKESLMVHGHLTGNPAKKKMVPTPKSKPKEGGWVQRTTPSVGATPSPAAPVACRPSQSPAEPICLLDSLDEELTAPALDSISQALALLSNAAKGLVQGDSPPSPDGPKTAPSSLHASPLLQKHKKSTINTPSSNTPLYVSTSSSPSRPPTVSPSLSSVRSEGLGSMKGGGALAQAHRQSVLSTQRPAGMGLSKANAPGSHSQPKPRLPPNQKGFGSNNTKANSGDPPLSSPSPSFSHSLSGAQAQQQSNFITPMQATLTKSSHSSTSPIIKLTPRLPNPLTPTTFSSPSPNPRPQAASSIHQYSSKSPAGFRPPFSGALGGPAKIVQGSYTPTGGQKTPSQIISSSANTSLTNTSSISKHSGSSPSPTTTSTSQRQRPAGGTIQGAKPIQSVSTQSVSSQLPQVSSASSSLLGSAPSLALGFGMLGGLVPVSLPFQFPSLLNLPPLGGNAGSSTGASGSSASNSSAFSLTQNLIKSLQSGSQVALPPHLQLAFSELYSSCPDVNQTQGGDVKRKSL
ncbi:ubinuclein-2-like isoform X1 [Coregonus clupeaformis]|uniref:ubinuclein-2-like isoform X1 n=1 Tax=Coregonus clupeaformis TaxID=59861 RepID=UPI001BDFCB61|nr:ubinuclein-2-like isoform X1 [Coregonus clupeaformis]